MDNLCSTGAFFQSLYIVYSNATSYICHGSKPLYYAGLNADRSGFRNGGKEDGKAVIHTVLILRPVFHIQRHAVTESVRANDPLPTVHRRAPGIVVSLLAVVFLGLVATQWRDRQSIGSINIEGATGLSINAVHAVADTFAGKQIESVTLADVREKLEALPYVRSAVVHLSGIRCLDVIINERMPVGHVVRGDGTLRYVDQTGAILPEAPVRTSHNVPLVRSNNGSALTQPELEHAVHLLVSAASIVDPMLYQTISEMRYDRSTKQLVIVTDRTTWKIDGATDRAATSAFADMNVFWKNTSSRVDMVHGTQIDLRWRHQVIVRRVAANA